MSGFLFLLSPNGIDAAWVHPLDLAVGFFTKYVGWTDCTDCTDAEFMALVISRQRFGV